MTQQNVQYRQTPTGIGITIPAGVGIGTNYEFMAAGQEVVAAALEWFLRRPDWTLERCLAIVKSPTKQQRWWISQAMKAAPLHIRERMRVARRHNLVPLVLRASLASLISGTSVTPTFMANYLAMGDDSTPAAAADVDLGNETIRGLFDDRSAVGEVAFLDKFFTADEVGGNSYEEVGIFVDGTGSADTGYLLSRVIVELSLASTETLTINASITINASV